MNRKHYNVASTELKGVQFDFHFIKKSFKLMKIIFPSYKSNAVILLIFIILVGLLKEVIVYQVGLVASKYYASLPQKDFNLFIQTTIFAVLVIVGAATTLSLTKFLSDILAVVCRENLTVYLQDLYLKNKSFYTLNMNSEYDNIDQRFTQDIYKMTSQLASIIFIMLSTPILVGFYTYKTADMSGWLGPVSAFVFFAVFTLINRLVLSWVSKSVYSLEKAEGNFRFKHVQIRTNCESIGFLNCVSLERKKTKQILYFTLMEQYKVAVRQGVLNFITNCSDYLGSILTYLAIGFAIFTGFYQNKSSAEITVIISKTSFFLMYLVNKLTSFIDMANNASIIIGITHRVYNVMDQLESENSLANQAHAYTNKAIDSISFKYLIPVDVVLRFQSFYGKFPFTQNQFFISDLNLDLCENQYLLIQGPSGCGKTSLLRCMSNLWPISRGSITLGDVILQKNNYALPLMILPQIPYLTNGTLLDQVLLPLSKCDVPKENEVATYKEVKDILVGMELSHIISAYDLDCYEFNDWSFLSPGEQQRLSFARVLFHKPLIAVLDECTSQVSEVMQTKMYEMLKSNGLTKVIISIAHRNTLQQLHNCRLELSGDDSGQWTFSYL